MNTTVSTLSTRMRRCFKLFIVVSLVSLGLQAAGCGTKGWMIWKIITTNLGTGTSVGAEIFQGLWEVKYCDAATDICATVGLDELDTLTSGTWTMHMLEFQVEVCLALALLTIFTVMLLVCFCSDYKFGILKGIVYCMIFLSLASGILALVASGRFGDGQRTVHELLLPRSPFLFPYSLILTGVGGILACLQALIMLPALKPWQRDPETQTQAPAAAAYAVDRPSQAHGSKPASRQGGGGQYPSQQSGAYSHNAGHHHSHATNGGYKASRGQQFHDTRYVHRY